MKNSLYDFFIYQIYWIFCNSLKLDSNLSKRNLIHSWKFLNAALFYEEPPIKFSFHWETVSTTRRMILLLRRQDFFFTVGW